MGCAATLSATSAVRADDESEPSTSATERPSSRLGTKRAAGPHYEVSAVFGAGGPLAAPGVASPVRVQGIHVLENHGYITKFAMLVLGGLAAGGERRKYVGSDSQYDYYEVSSLSADEVAAGASRDYVADLVVYAPLIATSEGSANAKGAEFRLGRAWHVGTLGGLPTLLFFGLQGAYVHASGIELRPGEGPHGAANPSSVHREKLQYGGFGLFGRLVVPLTVFAEAYAQWDANILSFGRFFKKANDYVENGLVYTSPLRVGVSVSPLERVFVRGEACVNGFGGYGLGWAIDAGVRL